MLGCVEAALHRDGITESVASEVACCRVCRGRDVSCCGTGDGVELAVCAPGLGKNSSVGVDNSCEPAAGIVLQADCGRWRVLISRSVYGKTCQVAMAIVVVDAPVQWRIQSAAIGRDSGA